ncbi:MAG: hypothetical protein ACFFES_16760 [Candidatus Thorarchaeota archaeon]
MSEKTLSKRRKVCLASIIVTVILFLQLYAMTAWSSNEANLGPSIVILQLSDDSDSDWAVNDIYSRLQEFIPDDPYIVDRLTIRKSSDPNIIKNLDTDIIIYVSHGGPLGIVTGKCLTSWMQLADIIENSKAPIHLFTTCESKRIVKYGRPDSEKILYTVPGSRPAEVSDIEVISTALLALGVDSSDVDTYRTQELTKAKENIENGNSIHIMSFSEVVLDTISSIANEGASAIDQDPSFPPELPENSTYESDQVVVRFNSTYTYDIGNYTSLSARIRDIVMNYFRGYTLFGGTSSIRAIENLMITCIEQYYFNATYWTYGASGTLENLLDSYQLDPTLSTFYYNALQLTELGWDYSDTELIGVSYSGVMQLGGMNTPYSSIELQIIASADESGEIQSVYINQTCVGGLHVDTTYTGSVANSIMGRNTGRSGSVFVDPLISTDYEYIENWPGHPYTGGSNSVGQLQSTDDYLTVTSIPDAQGWHGPSFVKTLPSSFRLQDLTTFSANLSLFYITYGATSTLVGLYDENRKPVLTLDLIDGLAAYPTIHTVYYREDGSSIDHYSSIPSSDFQGVLTITYDCVSGLYGELPGESRVQLCNPFEISWDRIVKYLVIESCRYYEDPLHDVRVYDIHVDSVYSDYVIVHENCQSTDNFFNSTLLEWGTLSNGTIEVPSGAGYITPTWIETAASGWHGPNYVQILTRPFRLRQLSEFSIAAEIFLAQDEEGKIEVGLFDDSKQCVMMFTWGGVYTQWDGEYYFNSYYHPEGGSTVSHTTAMDGDHKSWSARLWRDDGLNGGLLFSQIDAQVISQPWNVANDSRVISYIAVIPSRKGSAQLPDIRINDLQLVASIDPSQHAVAFVENCHDADGNPDLDNFYSLPGFGWGDFIDGNLYYHSSGYIYPSVEMSTYGWHGPNFVHILEQPIPLCNLTNFMVTGGIVQSSYTMGKIDVALFDENKDCVMNIYWADAWFGSELGYYHVAYYPETGGSHSDTTTNIGGSFTRTGRIWYENGHIMYEIEGIESGDFGPVGNPGRVIQYVVIRPSRSGVYIMNDLRLSGIALTSDYRPADAYLKFTDDCTDTDNFAKDLTFDWGVITDGDLNSPTGTSYITAINMASGSSGWHGPNFVHTLSTGLPLKNLSNFTVVGGIQQSSYTMGAMYVGLFDENMKCAMLIYWVDAWYGSVKAYHHTAFYPENGGSYYDTTGYIYTTFTRTGQMWYEDGSIKYEINGYQSGTLAAVDNPDRLIKYIVIRPMRSGSYPMVDLRIQDIVLKSDSALYREPGFGFIEDCKNVYNLPKDLSFGWGVITDGDFSSPSNSDYITPSYMAGGPSGWHGPNFVHVLEEPVRLYELSDFAVTGEIVQTVSTLGKMDVALYDDHMQPIMNIYWGDSWYSSKKAYHHVAFYPENGGGYYDTTDYIYDTSFLWTGRMWYEDGYIKYEIEDGPYGTLAAVDNPNRLIKYVVIRPSRSGNFAMVDLRIHQISVTSGFRTPTEQSVYYPVPVQTTQQEKVDGSTFGTQNEPDFNDTQQSFLDAIWTQVFESVSMYLAGWWPILHIILSILSAELNENIEIHVGIDLLGCFTLYQLTLISFLGDGTILDGVTLIAIAILETALLTGFPVIIATLIAADAAALTPFTVGWALALYAIAAILTVLLMSVIFWYTTIRAWNGEITHGTAMGMYAILFATFAFLVLGSEPASGIIAGTILSRANKITSNTLVEKATKALRTGKYFIMLMICFLGVMLFYHALAAS